MRSTPPRARTRTRPRARPRRRVPGPAPTRGRAPEPVPARPARSRAELMAWSPDYATADELATYLRIDDDVDDVQLAVAVSAASRAVDQAANRQFGNVGSAEARTYKARPDYHLGYWVVDTDDYQTASGLIVTVDGTAVTTFVKGPLNAAQKGRPWTRVVFNGTSETQPTVHPH